MNNKRLMIGAHSLAKLGSSRHSKDLDYLIHNPSIDYPYYQDKDLQINYHNASASLFFAEIWQMEEKNIGEIASPQALLELTAFDYTQHCISKYFQKADEATCDIQFLVRAFNLSDLIVVKKYISDDMANQIQQIIRSTRR